MLLHRLTLNTSENHFSSTTDRGPKRSALPSDAPKFAIEEPGSHPMMNNMSRCARRSRSLPDLIMTTREAGERVSYLPRYPILIIVIINFDGIGHQRSLMRVQR